MRPSLHEYYIGIAAAVARRSTCLEKQYGAVIVSQDNRITATGYNGNPSGQDNCCDTGECAVLLHNDKQACKAIHAEFNAIQTANGVEPGGTIYLTNLNEHSLVLPCRQCQDYIVAALIKNIVVPYRGNYHADKRIIHNNSIFWSVIDSNWLVGTVK